jgi:hypothetical protein
MEKHVLSKSTFIKGMQCEKALYLNKFHKELKSEVSAAQQAIFDRGTKVGELATQLFPGGVDCTPESLYDFQQAVIRTQQEINKGTTIIYEAAFQYNGVLAALDILVKDESGWKAYEVKSSTKVTETYHLDATIQYYAITNSGIELKDISIVYVNNQYVKNGLINVKQLFKIESVKDKVLELLPAIPAHVDKLKNILVQNEIPDIDIGPHCNDPYACDFASHCWKKIPKYSVFNIANLREDNKFELYKRNIVNFVDVPEDFPLNENQKMQVNSEVNNQTFIDKIKIKEFVSGLQYPLYFIDFETFATAVPIFDNSRPYQQLVFQYSLHLINEFDGQLIHKEFLAENNGQDPRIDFIEKLILDCGDKGDILVYNVGFEKGKLADLALAFPRFNNEINKIIERLKDLMVPFQQHWYYTPEMQGSYSIKKVLPALVPQLSYNDLNIKEGGTASAIFAAMLMGEFKGDINKTRQDLLDYCKLDTLAMVEICKKLNFFIKN